MSFQLKKIPNWFSSASELKNFIVTEKLRAVNVDSFEIGFSGSSFLHVPCAVNLSALINTKTRKAI